MATVTFDGDRVDITFGTWERIWVRRERFGVPLSAIRQAAHVDRPLGLARGARSGLLVSGYLKIGVWGIFRGPRRLVSARRGLPGLHLVLDGAEYDEVVLSHQDAARLARDIRQAVSVGA